MSYLSRDYILLKSKNLLSSENLGMGLAALTLVVSFFTQNDLKKMACQIALASRHDYLAQKLMR